MKRSCGVSQRKEQLAFWFVKFLIALLLSNSIANSKAKTIFLWFFCMELACWDPKQQLRLLYCRAPYAISLLGAHLPFILKKKKKEKDNNKQKKKTKKTDCRVFCFGASNLHSIWVPWSPPSFFSSCIPVLSPAVSTWLWLLASFHSMNFNYFCFQTGFPAFIFPCSL